MSIKHFTQRKEKPLMTEFGEGESNTTGKIQASTPSTTSSEGNESHNIQETISRTPESVSPEISPTGKGPAENITQFAKENGIDTTYDALENKPEQFVQEQTEANPKEIENSPAPQKEDQNLEEQPTQQKPPEEKPDESVQQDNKAQEEKAGNTTLTFKDIENNDQELLYVWAAFPPEKQAAIADALRNNKPLSFEDQLIVNQRFADITKAREQKAPEKTPQQKEQQEEQKEKKFSDLKKRGEELKGEIKKLLEKGEENLTDEEKKKLTELKEALQKIMAEMEVATRDTKDKNRDTWIKLLLDMASIMATGIMDASMGTKFSGHQREEYRTYENEAFAQLTEEEKVQLIAAFPPERQKDIMNRLTNGIVLLPEDQMRFNKAYNEIIAKRTPKTEEKPNSKMEQAKKELLDHYDKTNPKPQDENSPEYRMWQYDRQQVEEDTKKHEVYAKLIPDQKPQANQEVQSQEQTPAPQSENPQPTQAIIQPETSPTPEESKQAA